MDWNTFFAVSAGASATLVGLLFIGVQLNIEMLRENPTGTWNTLARSTYTIFSLLFLNSFLFLIPSVSERMHGHILSLMFGAAIIRTVVAGRRLWTQKGSVPREQARQVVQLIVIPLVACGVGLRGSLALATSGLSPDDAKAMICLGFWILYATALRNSWSLLFDARLENSSHG